MRISILINPLISFLTMDYVKTDSGAMVKVPSTAQTNWGTIGGILTKLDNLELECDITPILEDLTEINTKIDILMQRQEVCCDKINAIFTMLPELKCRFPRPNEDVV